MRRDLRQQQPAQRLARQHPLLHRAVLDVGAEQRFEREQRCEHGRHPDDTGGNRAQLREIRRRREREQRRDDDIEQERLRDVVPATPRERQVALDGEQRRATEIVRHHAVQIECSHARFIRQQALMRSSDDDAALGEMAAQELLDETESLDVEVRRGLVEDPEQRGIEREPRQREPPFLACRQRPRKRLRVTTEPDPLERGPASRAVRRMRRPARYCRFSCAVRSGFSAFRWPRYASSLRNGSLADETATPRQLHVTAVRGQEPAEHPQQRRLASAVRAEHLQEIAGTQRERDVTQDLSLSAPGAKCTRFEQCPVRNHRVPVSAQRNGRLVMESGATTDGAAV